MRRLALLLWIPAAACGDGDDLGADAAAGRVDARAGIDAAVTQADAAPTQVPLPGFGTITGQCGVIDAAQLDGATPLWFQGQLDFGTDRYDDPAERPLLTAAGLEVLTDGNAGGSSVYSEVFAMEWLARCELAGLVKSETEVVYDDPMSKKIDILVELDGRKVGVSVTRAMTFPLGQPYQLAAATTLFERKLDDLQLATTQVSAGDRWSKQMLAVLAYDDQHAQVAMEAWTGLDAQTRDDTLLVVAVTGGDDTFIYTDQ